MEKFIIAIIISTIISLIIGPFVIGFLKKLKLGQNIRKEGPKTHLAKAGTPTMGGMIFIISTIITLLIIDISPGKDALLVLVSVVLFGIVGSIDDMFKIKRKQSGGLTPRGKMILLLIVATGIAIYTSNTIGTEIYIPIINENLDLKGLFIPFIIVYFVGTTNAVNLTDGVDGLAASVTMLVLTFFALISLAWGYYDLALVCGALIGAILGFLRYNSYPASVIMGDTGSLALGGALASIAMILKLEIILVIVGGVYVMEVLSVIIQVTSLRLRKKRVFKMSPLHHHFEISGWHEHKVVSVFGIITVLLCLIAFLILS